MRVRVTMVDSQQFEIEDKFHNTLDGFIKYIISKRYYMLNYQQIDAIITSNIVTIERIDGHNNDENRVEYANHRRDEQ